MTILKKPKAECPLCGKYLVNVNRHVKDLHGCAEPLRVTVPFSEKLLTSRQIELYRRCSICYGKLFRNLDRHLKRIHGLSGTDDEYVAIMKQSLVERDERERRSVACPYRDSDKEEEDDDDDEVPNRDRKRRRGSNLFTLLPHFYDWMVGKGDCGLSPNTGRQHRAQARAILSSVCAHLHDDHLEGDGPHERDFSYHNLKTYWFRSNRIANPSTLRSYVESLIKFVDFLLQRHDHFLPIPAGRLSKRGLDSLRLCCVRWMKSLKRDIRKRRNVRRQQSSDDIRSYRDLVQMYLRSDYVRRIEEDGEDGRNGNGIRVRNHLMFLILLFNAQRPMPIVKMTLGDFVNAGRNEEGERVVRVSRHKTMHTHGDAHLYFNEKLYSLVERYIDRYRPACSNDGTVFVSRKDARSMNASSFCFALNSTWRRALNVKKKKITATIVRKLAIDRFRNAPPGVRLALAKHMGHSYDTVQKYYELSRDRGDVVRAGRHLVKSFAW